MKRLFSEKAQYVRKLFLVAVVFASLLAQGCLEMEQELIIKQDGSGTLKAQGVLGESFTKMVKMAESMKESAGGEATAAGMLSVSEGDLALRFKGEGVRIASSQFETKENKLHFSYTIEFDNLQNLVDTRAFQERQISFYRDRDNNLAFQSVTSAVRQLFIDATAEEIKKELKIDIILTLPGKVLESNADSQEGATLRWRYTKDKLKPDVLTALCEGTGLAFVAQLPAEPKITATSACLYDPTGKVDPFRPFILEIKRPKETIAEPLQPLQRYEISQLKLVGVIWMAANPRAVLEDAAGKGFIISKGALVGKNEGRVSEIFQDEVIITEKSTDILGETKIKEIKLKLHEQEAKSK